MSDYNADILEDEPPNQIVTYEVYLDENNDDEKDLNDYIEYSLEDDDDDVVEVITGDETTQQKEISPDLIQHTLIINQAQNTKAPFHCVECVEDFATAEAFTNAHMITEHDTENTATDVECIDLPQWHAVDEDIVLHTDEDTLKNVITLEFDSNDQRENETICEVVGEDINMNVKQEDEEKFMCDDCKGVFDDLEEAEQHECHGNVVSRVKIVGEGEEAVAEYAFDCPFCTRQFNTLGNLQKHYTVCHKKPKESDVEMGYKYKCPECFKILGSMTTFIRHMRMHSSAKKQQTPRTYVNCDVCNTTFGSQKNLKLHMKIHDEKRGKSIQDAIPADAAMTYNEQNQFYCEICQKKFSENLLPLHKKMHMEDGHEFSCSKCNKRFENSTLHRIHMESHIKKSTEISPPRRQKQPIAENGALLYPCNSCHYVFKRPHEKIKHERVHTGEKPYSCEVCGKRFRVSYSLTIHLRTHTNFRPYECEICFKRYKSHPVYMHHRKTHENKRDYKCEMCEKSFRTAVQLAGHRNSHLKPFSCTECNRPFASLYAVRCHMKTHEKKGADNELSRRICNICGALYARVYALRCHLKEAHNIDVDAPKGAEVNEQTSIAVDDDGEEQENVEYDTNLTAEQIIAEEQMREGEIAAQMITKSDEVVVNWFDE